MIKYIRRCVIVFERRAVVIQCTSVVRSVDDTCLLVLYKQRNLIYYIRIYIILYYIIIIRVHFSVPDRRFSTELPVWPFSEYLLYLYITYQVPTNYIIISYQPSLLRTHYRLFITLIPWFMAFTNKSRAYKHKVLLESSADDVDFSVSVSSCKRTILHQLYKYIIILYCVFPCRTRG